MILRSAAAVILLLTASPASAEWRYTPTEELAGYASVMSDGRTLTVTCGNSGELGVMIEPEPDGPGNRFGFTVGGQRFEVEMLCAEGMCDSGGGGGLLPLIEALMAGASVSVSAGTAPYGTFPLKGSSAAIRRMEASGCPGF